MKPTRMTLTATIDRPNRCTFEIVGGPYLVSEVVEQLGWLISAVQLPPICHDVKSCYPVLNGLTSTITEITARTAVAVRCYVRVEWQNLRTHPDAVIAHQASSCQKPFLVHGYPNAMSNRDPLTPSPFQGSYWIQPNEVRNWNDLRIMMLPNPIQSLVETAPRTSIRICSEDDRSFQNRLKLSLESHTGYMWDWWPLISPIRNVQKGMWRIEWAVSKVPHV